MRMSGGLSMATFQELHHALWSTYLGFSDDVAGGPQSLGSALELLCSLWTKLPRAVPVVGTALWDVLRGYAKKRPPANLARLLHEVLGLEIGRARQLRTEDVHSAFPPFPQPMIADSSFRVWPQGRKVELSVCLEANFDTLSLLADPEQWPRLCPMFWASVTPNGKGWDAEWIPPVMEGTKPLNVRLLKVTKPQFDPTKTMADIDMIPEGSFGRASLHFDMQPEEQKPGWTRVKHQRIVAFGPEVPPAYRSGTVSYWTKSEIACLVLQ